MEIEGSRTREDNVEFGKGPSPNFDG